MRNRREGVQGSVAEFMKSCHLRGGRLKNLRRSHPQKPKMATDNRYLIHLCCKLGDATVVKPWTNFVWRRLTQYAMRCLICLCWNNFENRRWVQAFDGRKPSHQNWDPLLLIPVGFSPLWLIAWRGVILTHPSLFSWTYVDGFFTGRIQKDDLWAWMQSNCWPLTMFCLALVSWVGNVSCPIMFTQLIDFTRCFCSWWQIIAADQWNCSRPVVCAMLSWAIALPNGHICYVIIRIDVEKNLHEVTLMFTWCYYIFAMRFGDYYFMLEGLEWEL